MSSTPLPAPPIAPMLGRLARELPRGDYLYEPKWDGFRCLAFRTEDQVDLRSRRDRRLGRYFPEITSALAALGEKRFVIDGELMVAVQGRFDFQALMRRIHPASSRVSTLRQQTPALFVAFDALAVGNDDLRERHLPLRRVALERLLAGAAPPVYLTPMTANPEVACLWLERHAGAGIDGIMAKSRTAPYEPGVRAMVKFKPERLAACVVGGLRLFGDPPVVASLLLGLYGRDGELVHVGVASGLSERRRAELLHELIPFAVALAGHPWERGFLIGGGPTGRLPGAAGRWTPDMELDWLPLEPRMVCEVAYDQLDDHRFRHSARFRGWRPDRDPASCTLDQLTQPATSAIELLAS